MPCHEVFKTLSPLFFFFPNFACVTKDMENSLGLSVAVPEDNSQRVSHVRLDTLGDVAASWLQKSCR